MELAVTSNVIILAMMSVMVMMMVMMMMVMITVASLIILVIEWLSTAMGVKRILMGICKTLHKFRS